MEKYQSKQKNTVEEQTKQGRRPRINWASLYPMIKNYCTKVFEGEFNDIF